jgi:hypothetical protein
VVTTATATMATPLAAATRTKVLAMINGVPVLAPKPKPKNGGAK